MGTLSSPASTLLGLGADAMDNMFDIQIDLPADLPDMASFESFASNLTIRGDGFQPPKLSVKTYEVKYKAVSIERPATRLEGKREFSITFRLDANYLAYRVLGAWKSMIAQASAGYVTNGLFGAKGDNPGSGNDVFGTVTVSSLARPIYMSADSRYRHAGVTDGKFTGEGTESVGLPTSAELMTWKFEQVWLSDLDEPSYKTDGGDIIKVKATFKFGEFTDPIYGRYAG